MRNCPYCNREVADNAVRCFYCKRNITGERSQIDYPWSFKDLGIILILYLIIYYPISFLLSWVLNRVGFDSNSITLLNVLIQWVILVFLIYLNIKRGYHRSFLKSLNIEIPKNFNLFYTLFIALGLTILFKLIPKASNVPEYAKLLQTRLNFIIFVFFAIAIAPISEEIFFRGYIFPIIKVKYGLASSVLLIAFLATVLHILFAGLIWNLLFKIMILSIILTLLRAITNSTLTSIFTHFFYNVLVVIGMHFKS